MATAEVVDGGVRGWVRMEVDGAGNANAVIMLLIIKVIYKYCCLLSYGYVLTIKWPPRGVGRGGGRTDLQPPTIKFQPHTKQNPKETQRNNPTSYDPMYSALGWVVLVYPYPGRQGGGGGGV